MDALGVAEAEFEKPSEVSRKAQSYWLHDFDPPGHETQQRMGWLYNYTVCDVTDEAKLSHQAVTLLFFGEDGESFKCHVKFRPYFYVMPGEGEDTVREVELGLRATFGNFLADIQRTEKEDLDMPGHLSGKKRLLLKLVFWNVQDLKKVRDKVAPAVQRNRRSTKNFSFAIRNGEYMNTESSFYHRKTTAFLDRIVDMREFDVHYHVRYSIDQGVFVGKWYKVTGKDGEYTIEADESGMVNPQPRVLAFDIETTKAPLKFPQPEIDQIYMISWMLDGRGFLIINRAIVTEDIEDFEYTPKPAYEGKFKVWNVADEQALLRKWYQLVQEQRPHVYVTYNGDGFDFPFIEKRSEKYGINMNKEIGFQNTGNETLAEYCLHLDCFYWVNRDSYLPQGSRGLKAVAKYKLGYEPLEIHHEDMLPMARDNPQKMAAYSVSDAVATYYLFMKYVNPFIFSLCTIIPMKPDEVLRKGSGTICEQLLMVKAYEKNVVFPNKQQTVREKFYKGHLLDQDTYVGGHVEALRSGAFRSDVPIPFDGDPAKYQELIDQVDSALVFAITVENKMKVEDVENYDEIKADIIKRLEGLRDKPKRMECPHIVHLDVSAMYPNIILTNRLQPPAMVSEEICAACPYNREENNCKRKMEWKWRGEHFVLSKGEFMRLKQQLETERFDQDKVDATKTKMAGKKDWKFKKRDPLVDKRKGGKGKGGKGKGFGGGYQGGGIGYKRGNGQRDMEFKEKLMQAEMRDDSDEDAEADVPMTFKDLSPEEQFSMVKKRVTDYCRKAYAKLHATAHEDRVATVCQRENEFFIGTVLNFRDRRYEYKRALKSWKAKLEDAKAGKEGAPPVKECEARVVVNDSLQLAHKCILNSFYGYVMRKGSRWYSMEMAAAITHCGGSLIKMAKDLVDHVGVSLELDTDGIWCCLPNSFPMDYTFKTKKGKGFKIEYSCVMLNKDTADKYTNHQYQNQISPTEFKTHSECSILFEIDGPYWSMVLPASKEEGVGIKKRYAVFEHDGSLAELKGFELKRRGELQIIKDFQAIIFGKGSPWLAGKGCLKEVYGEVAKIANQALDILYSKGEGLEDEEIMEKIQESASMSRRLDEYPKDQKGMALTCARRVAMVLGDDMVKDKGLTCIYIVSKKPVGRSVTERPIPIQIFQTDQKVRVHWLRKWCEDRSIGVGGDVDLRDILDWDYYINRLSGCIQKIVTIPAAYQGVANPCPRVVHPDWLAKRVREQNSGLKQQKMTLFTHKREKYVDTRPPPSPSTPQRGGGIQEIEDVGRAPRAGRPSGQKRERDAEGRIVPPPPPRPPQQFVDAYCAGGWDGAAKGVPSTSYCASWASSFLKDASFKKWVGSAKAAWRAPPRGADDAAKARRTDGPAPSALQQMLRSAAEQPLAGEWDIVELRQLPTDPPQIVRALTLIGDSVKYLRVHVPSSVLVNARAECPELVDDYHAKPVQAQPTLPRRRARHKLYEVPVDVSSRDAERDVLHKLRCHTGVEGIYESRVPATLRAAVRLGNRCRVDVAAHRARGAKDSDLFHAADLVAIPPRREPGAPRYLARGLAPVFVFHCGDDAGRGVVAVVLPHSRTARVAYWRPAYAYRDDPPLRWREICADASADAARQLGAGPDAADAAARAAAELGAAPGELAVTHSFVADEAAAWRAAEAALRQELSVARRVVVAAQTQLPAGALPHRLPTAAAFPAVRVPFHRGDAEVMRTSLQWQREIGQRALFRSASARPYVAELIRMARFAGLPVGNVASDANVNVLDAMYARLLTKHTHVLWCSPGSSPDMGHDGMDDEDVAFLSRVQEAEQPVEVQVPGSYHTWVLELDVSHLEVVSVLHSQALIDSEDPSSFAFRDSGVTSHFQLLRELTTDIYTKTMVGGQAEGGILLSDFTRWIRSRSSLLYEPQLAVFLWNLAKRLFGALLTRLAELGCKVVYADFTRVVVATPKSDFADAFSFTQYLLGALRQQPVGESRPFEIMEIQVTRWWSEYLFLSKHNYAGMAVPGPPPAPGAAAGTLDLGGVTPEDYATQATVEMVWGIAHRFPGSLAAPSSPLFRFHLFVREFIAALSKERSVAVATVAAETADATVASREEKIRELTYAGMERKVAEFFTPRMFKEINNIQKMEEDRRKEARAAGLRDLAESPENVAAEYVKGICHVLGQEGKLASAVWQMKQSALQVLDIGSHSPDATWRPRAAGVELPAVMCTYCQAVNQVDFLPGGPAAAAALAADRAAREAPWACKGHDGGVCGQLYDRAVIESALVGVANARAAAAMTCDLVCNRCRQPQQYDMQKMCACGGDWFAATSAAHEAAELFERLHAVGELHRLAWLTDVTRALLRRAPVIPAP